MSLNCWLQKHEGTRVLALRLANYLVTTMCSWLDKLHFINATLNLNLTLYVIHFLLTVYSTKHFNMSNSR